MTKIEDKIISKKEIKKLIQLNLKCGCSLGICKKCSPILTLIGLFIQQAKQERDTELVEMLRKKKWNVLYGLNCRCGREWFARQEHNKDIQNIISKLKKEDGKDKR